MTKQNMTMAKSFSTYIALSTINCDNTLGSVDNINHSCSQKLINIFHHQGCVRRTKGSYRTHYIPLNESTHLCWISTYYSMRHILCIHYRYPNLRLLLYSPLFWPIILPSHFLPPEILILSSEPIESVLLYTWKQSIWTSSIYSL